MKFDDMLKMMSENWNTVESYPTVSSKSEIREAVQTKDGDNKTIIRADIDLSNQDLTSLTEMFPGIVDIVDGDFDCSINDLTDLKGCPRLIEGDFNCSHNPLKSLDGFPRQVNGTIKINSIGRSFVGAKKVTVEDVTSICKVDADRVELIEPDGM